MNVIEWVEEKSKSHLNFAPSHEILKEVKFKEEKWVDHMQVSVC